jgi:uncharacterized membrane protein
MMNMEIIPNWHPIFVHFTIGLLSISALLYLAGSVFKKGNLLVVARWNLWIGAVITVGTVIAGFDAYNSVAHDAASHAAMTDHKNWALPTAAVFGLLALWAAWTQRGVKAVSPAFVVIIVLASVLLVITGYKGGEVVYRHGTGVMRMPQIQGDGGHESHEHGEAVGTDHHEMEKTPPQKEQQGHDHSGPGG